MYAEGLGTAPVSAIALKWYRQAAEQGFSQAQFNLAHMYENGIGIRRDVEQMITWYERAAAQGNLHAQYKLGSIYLNGEGVEVDRETAYAWFGIAVAGGHEQALSPRDAIAIQLSEEELEAARLKAREMWMKYELDKKRLKNGGVLSG